VHGQRSLKLRQLPVVRARCLLGHGRQGPSEVRVVLDIESNLLGELAKPPVVIPTLPAGVLGLSPMRKPVRRLMQLGCQHSGGATLKALPSDEQLGDSLFAGELPAIGSEVAEAKLVAMPP
jgi:hypothetical protein